MKKICLALMMLAPLGTTAYALEAPYLGFDAALATLNTKTDDAQMPAIRVRLGSEITRYVGVETQLVRGVVEDEVKQTVGSFDVGLDGSAGIYLRLQLPVGDAFTLYGLAGYAQSWLKVGSTVPGFSSFKTHDKDFSGGGGIDVHLTKNTGLTLDYMEYIEGLSSVALGVRVKM